MDSRARSGPALPALICPQDCSLWPLCASACAHSCTNRLGNASRNDGRDTVGQDDFVLNLASVTSNQVFSFYFKNLFFLAEIFIWSFSAIFSAQSLHAGCQHFTAVSTEHLQRWAKLSLIQKMYSFTWITVLICQSDNRQENICSDASVSPALRRKQCNRAQWWFTTLPLSLSAMASVGCSGQQGALVRALRDRSLSRGSQGRSGGTILMRIILAPHTQPSSPSPSWILSPVPAGAAVYDFLTSNGLLPEQLPAGRDSHVPAGKRSRGEPSGRKKKLYKLVIVEPQLFIKLGWQWRKEKSCG